MTLPGEQPAVPAPSWFEPEGVVPESWQAPPPTTMAEQGAPAQGQAQDQTAETATDNNLPTDAGAETGAARASGARLAVGLASLAADRLRGSARTSDALVVTVGLVGRTADKSVAVVRRVSTPPFRAAWRGARWATGLPGIRRLSAPVERARDRFAHMTAEARTRGEATVAAGRDDAVVLVQMTVDNSLAWAQAQAVPKIVDGMMPYLVNEVVPKLIEGALPEIRARVLPVVIEDLANEPRVRELLTEQSRSVMRDAAEQLRTSTAAADDRVESAFRRVFPGTRAESHVQPQPGQESTPLSERPPAAGDLGDNSSGTAAGE